jgi:tRNA threonylcarbamoyl adenosine modification protein YeaZ
MVLVIDTSSARSALAVVKDGIVVGEEAWESDREEDLAHRVAALADPRELTAVAVALGPGSFTGLRLGVSFGVGLAMGRRIPLLGLGTLEIQAARARAQAIGLADAGRNRVYWLGPDGRAGHGEPAEVPRQAPAVGWLRGATADLVRREGVRLLTEKEVDTFGTAASKLVGEAPRLGYDTVELRYMHSFGRVR